MTNNLSMPPCTVIPVLGYTDVRQAVESLCDAFGFSERLRIGEHRSQLVIGDGAVIVTGATEATATQSPDHAIMVRVANLDAHFERARASGTTIANPPTTQPYGERQYNAIDIGGHHWTFSQTVANVDPSAWGGELLLR